MNQKTSSITRQCAWLAFFCVIAVAAMGVHGSVIIANYLTTASALEFLGQDARSVADDALLGPLLGVIAGDASRLQFFAMGMSVCIALAFLLIIHAIMEGCRTSLDAWQWHETPVNALVGGVVVTEDVKQTEVHARHLKVARTGVEALLATPALVCVVWWDVSLFAFAFTHDASSSVSDAVVSGIVRAGAWGYVALTMLACIGLEQAFRKIGEHWHLLLLSVLPDAATEKEAPVRSSAGAASSGPKVRVRNTAQQTTAHSPSSAYTEVNGPPIGGSVGGNAADTVADRRGRRWDRVLHDELLHGLPRKEN